MDATTREYIAKFRAPEDPTDHDATRRLRNTLKGLLRKYGWKCVTIRHTTDQDDQQPQAR